MACSLTCIDALILAKSRTLLLALADIDKYPSLRHRLQVNSPPTLYVTQSGSVVEILSPTRHIHGDNFDVFTTDSTVDQVANSQENHPSESENAIPLKSLHELFVRIKNSFGIDTPLLEDDFLDEPGQIDKIFNDSILSADQDLLRITSVEDPLTPGIVDAALPKYKAVLNHKASGQKQKAIAYSGLFRAYVLSGNRHKALHTLKTLKENFEPEFLLKLPPVKQAFSLARISQLVNINLDSVEGFKAPRIDVEYIQSLKEKVYGTDMDDMDLAYKYTCGVIAGGNYEEGVMLCLDMIRKDKSWNNCAARDLLLDIFEALGASHEISQMGRKRLNNIWLR